VAYPAVSVLTSYTASPASYADATAGAATAAMSVLPLPLLPCVLSCQALVDVAAQGGCLASALAVMELVQSLVQVGG